MKTNNLHFARWLVAVIATFILSISNAWGDTYTLGWGSATGSNYTNFTATSGTVANIVSFSTAKNSSSNNPAYNSNNSELRLYYHSGGSGGSITLTPATGVTITGFTITTSTSPTTKYKVGSGSLTSITLSNNSGSVTGLSVGSTSSITIQNCNTSNTQLRIKTITITYSTASSCTNPTISSQPTGATYTQGASATALSVTANGTSLTYQWYSNTSSSTTGASSISGATSSSYTPSTESAGTTYYYCVVSSGSCSTTSNIVGVTVNLPNYTVTYNAGTGTCATTSFTQTAGVRSTTLPTATPPATCTGWSFAGWCTASAGDEEDNTTSPGSILTGSYEPTGNVTLYAVYTKAGAGGGSATLTKMVEGNTLADGDKIVVVANGTDIAMYQETTSTSYVQTWDCSTLNATSVGADDKNWWDVTETTDGFYLGDEDNGYLNMSSNNLYCNSTQSVWTLSDLDDGTFRLQSNGRNLSYRSDLSTTKWRMGGSNYGTSGNTILDIYKYSPSGGSTTYYMTSLVCCTSLGTINGSILLSRENSCNIRI